MNCRWEETTIGQRCVVCDRDLRLPRFMPNLLAACRGTIMPSGPCQYRGVEIDQRKPAGCKCQEPVPIYSCSLLGQCSESYVERGLTVCMTCGKRK